VPVPHARAAVWSLLVVMAAITGPRDPRGVRHPLVAVLGVAVVATLAGAASYRELGSVAAGLPQELLSLLGARWDLPGLIFIAPSAGTLRRLLIALDADELDRAVGAWRREHADRDAGGRTIALDGKDPRHRLARGRPASPPRQRPPSHGHPAQPGPRPVRHPPHHPDQTTVQSIGRNPLRAVPLIT
jgi:DDE_Tnp_1-associated